MLENFILTRQARERKFRFLRAYIKRTKRTMLRGTRVLCELEKSEK